MLVQIGLQSFSRGQGFAKERRGSSSCVFTVNSTNEPFRWPYRFVVQGGKTMYVLKTGRSGGKKAVAFRVVKESLHGNEPALG